MTEDTAKQNLKDRIIRGAGMMPQIKLSRQKSSTVPCKHESLVILQGGAWWLKHQFMGINYPQLELRGIKSVLLTDHRNYVSVCNKLEI